jgi:cytochrome P450
MQEKFDFIREVLEVKRVHRGEDVISDLLASELSSSEIEGIILILMTSGRDSVAYMITTTTVALLVHPEQLAILRHDASRIAGAVEEFMRFGTMFLTLFPRTATEDVLLDGVLIRAGQTVSVSPVAANRDERRFERPEVFDVGRDAFGHLGFGHGPHGCVGQQLARLEIREAITQLLAGIPSLSLVGAEQLAPMPFAHDVATYEAGSATISWE